MFVHNQYHCNRHFTFETIYLWFSGRPSLSTRVGTRILFFSSLRLYFASLMSLYPNVWWFKKPEGSLSESVEESKEEVKPLFFGHRAGHHSTSRAPFWTGRKVRERNYVHKCFHSSWFLERTEEDQGNAVLTSPDLVTAWFFGCTGKQRSYIFRDVCKIYKPSLKDVKCKSCNSREPFLSCAQTCVFSFNPFLPISGFSAPHYGLDSVALCSQVYVQLIYSIPSLIKETLITCLCELSSSWAAHYWGT